MQLRVHKAFLCYCFFRIWKKWIVKCEGMSGQAVLLIRQRHREENRHHRVFPSTSSISAHALQAERPLRRAAPPSHALSSVSDYFLFSSNVYTYADFILVCTHIRIYVSYLYPFLLPHYTWEPKNRPWCNLVDLHIAPSWPLAAVDNFWSSLGKLLVIFAVFFATQLRWILYYNRLAAGYFSELKCKSICRASLPTYLIWFHY